MTKVIHIRNAPNDWQNNANYVYIGRPSQHGSGYFGNPHPIGFCSKCDLEHDRAGCIAAFKEDFEQRVQEDPEYLSRVISLHNKTLICYCQPLACHGHVIQKWLTNYHAD